MIEKYNSDTFQTQEQGWVHEEKSSVNCKRQGCIWIFMSAFTDYLQLGREYPEDKG